MKISKRVKAITPSLTLEISAEAKKLKASGKDVVSFGAGEPDFNTPAFIRDAAKDAMDEGLIKYTPASGLVSLKKAICNKLLVENGLKYEPEQIVVSNGAKHSLFNVISALVEDGDEVIIPSPYWLTYPELVRLAGGKPVFVETKKENGFKMTEAELEAAITDKTVALILNNPNNPTGSVYNKDEIYALAKVIEKTDVTVIADEIYEKLNYTDSPVVSIATYSDKLKAQTVIVNGVSKSFAMTGWRIGFTASPLPLAKAMGSMQSHTTSNPSAVSQYAAIAAYDLGKSEHFIRKMHASFSRRNKIICESLDKIKDLTYVVPQGAFYVFVDLSNVLGKSYNGEAISSPLVFAKKLLAEKLVAVVPCESFGSPSCIRLTYAISEEDIVKGISRMGEFVSELK